MTWLWRSGEPRVRAPSNTPQPFSAPHHFTTAHLDNRFAIDHIAPSLDDGIASLSIGEERSLPTSSFAAVTITDARRSSRTRGPVQQRADSKTESELGEQSVGADTEFGRAYGAPSSAQLNAGVRRLMMRAFFLNASGGVLS